MRYLGLMQKSTPKGDINENWEAYSSFYAKSLMCEHSTPISIDEMVEESKKELSEAYKGLE